MENSIYLIGSIDIDILVFNGKEWENSEDWVRVRKYLSIYISQYI